MAKKLKTRIREYMPNPLTDSPGYVPRKKRKKKKKKVSRYKALTGYEKKQLDLDRYKTRAKRLRPLFKDVFSAKSGFDLRSPGSWTPAQKAKVTRYFRVMAPHITGPHIVKRYRKPSSVKAVVSASTQEKFLPGQTGVAFRYDEMVGESSVQVELKRSGRVIINQHGLGIEKFTFSQDAIASGDYKGEVESILASTDANVFRILTGSNLQNKALARDQIMDEIVRLMEQYSPSGVSAQSFQRPFTDWLNGLVAYNGSVKRTMNKVQRIIVNHKKEMAARRRAHLDVLAGKAKAERLAKKKKKK